MRNFAQPFVEDDVQLVIVEMKSCALWSRLQVVKSLQGQ